MPKYHRKTLSENRGKRAIICGLTGKTWKAWKGWCYRVGLELYSPDTLKLWLQRNPKALDTARIPRKENLKRDRNKNE